MPKPYPYQLIAARWLVEQRAALLADEMGLGKTVTAILAADLARAGRILIVCPAIARDMWARAIRTWQQQGRTIQVIRTAADAKNLHGDVLIVSYSLVAKVLPALRVLRFDVLILDEAQALKSIDAVRTKAIYGRGGLIACVLRVWLLSGTIMPNHPGEIWVHYYVLWHGKLLYWPFVQRYCLVRETEYGLRIIGTNPAHADELAKFLSPYILRRTHIEVLPDLPPLRLVHLPISPDNVPPAPEITIEIEAILCKLERDEALSITERMALATLLLWTGVAKVPAVLQLILEELPGLEKIVVFAVHRPVITQLQDGLGSLAASIHGDSPHGHARR